MKLEKRLKWSLLRASGLFLLLPFLLGGCVAAVPLMLATQAASLGIGALAVTRSVQLSTGGSLEVAIGENEVPGENKMVLADISRLSIWPGHEAQVFVADNLQKSKAFDLIVTPSKVSRAIREANLDGELGNLTETEMLQSFRTICRETETGAVVAFTRFGMKSDMNAWSFSRPTMNYKCGMYIYALDRSRIIYTSVVKLIVSMGGSNPSQHEINQKAAKIVADELIAFRKGAPPAKKADATRVDENDKAFVNQDKEDNAP